MEVRVGVAKVPKFDYKESGDSLEVVERPRGGMSVVIADGQGSGEPAKRVSRLVVSKAVSMVADGARDGAVARAVHDFLHALKGGKVLSTLSMVSADAYTDTVVICRNGSPPVTITGGGVDMTLGEECPPIGVGKRVKPSVTEVPMREGMVIIAVTDGVTSAGKRSGLALEIPDLAGIAKHMDPFDPGSIAKGILFKAMELDEGKPTDDMTVLVMSLVQDTMRPRIRQMYLSLPF